MSKIERLLNLVALLRETRRPLPAAEIRRKIRGYADQGDEAFHRMFERDKTEIRELGFEVLQEDTDAWGGEVGYRIVPDRTPLADPGMSPDEIAALALAAQVGGSEDGAMGFLKLAGGEDPGPSATGWVLPRVALEGPIAVLSDAIARRKLVRFDYRSGGGDEVTARDVEPHGLYHRGTWYLVGYDRARDDVRRFKLTRVQGKITVARGADADFDPPEAPDLDVIEGPWDGRASLETRVAFAPEIAWWAERRTGATRVAERDDGWVELAMPAGDLDTFAGWIAGFGARAEALGPPELREAVIAHLRALVGA